MKMIMNGHYCQAILQCNSYNLNKILVKKYFLLVRLEM